MIGYYFEDQPLWDVVPGRQRKQLEAASAAAATGLLGGLGGGNGSAPTDWVNAMRSLPGPAPGKAAYVDWLYGNFDIISGPFIAHLPLQPTPMLCRVPWSPYCPC